MAFFLGIDGGGTKTRCLLGDENRVLARATNSGSNIVRLGVEAARTAIHRSICEVCSKVKIKPGQIVSACAGVAGAAGGHSREEIRRIISELIHRDVEVVGDMVIAHESTLGGQAGIVVIAGTGSIAYGRNESGRTARFGGWGYMISDEGSGHWVGVQAVASVVRSAAQGNESQLVSRLLAHWGLKSVDDLVRLANASPPPDFAGLFPVVLALDDRDPLASEILEHAGTELAQLAAEVYRSLWTSRDVVDLALTGGVAQNSARVRDAFQRQIQAREVKARVRLAEFDPAEGALAIARKLAFRNA